MPKTSASEMKRLIAAVKRRKPSDNPALQSLIQLRPQPAHQRQFVQRFTQFMEKGGLDVDKLNKNLKSQKKEPPHLREKLPRWDKKAVAATKRALRHGIEERRR